MRRRLWIGSLAALGGCSLHLRCGGEPVREGTAIEQGLAEMVATATLTPVDGVLCRRPDAPEVGARFGCEVTVAGTGYAVEVTLAALEPMSLDVAWERGTPWSAARVERNAGREQTAWAGVDMRVACGERIRFVEEGDPTCDLAGGGVAACDATGATTARVIVDTTADGDVAGWRVVAP